MENLPRGSVVRTSKLVCVIELDRDVLETPRWWRTTCTLPGREGVFNRVWPVQGDRMEAAQLVDLSSWIAQSVADAILTSTGVQGRLDEDS